MIILNISVDFLSFKVLPLTSNIIASLLLRWIRSLGLVVESFLNSWKTLSRCVEIYILFSYPFVVAESLWRRFGRFVILGFLGRFVNRVYTCG